MADVLGTAHNIPCIQREELDEFALVGSGSSAKVFRAKWRGTTVAVKQLHNPLELSLDTVVKEVAGEIKLWSQLKHPHVVQFLGMTPDLWLVMEFMEHGSLKTLMRRKQIPPDMRIRLLFQVSLAMDYLHSRKVVHRDLNPNNIMVSGPMRDLQAKVADFGLSRMEQALLQHTKSVGTPVYAAPEVLYGGLFTPKSDSYSFGLTLWFVETGEEPFDDIRSHFELIEAVVKSKRKPDAARCSLFPDLVVQCTSDDPERRPTFSSIAGQLQAGLAKQALPAIAQGSPPITPPSLPSVPAASSLSSGSGSGTPDGTPSPPTAPLLTRK
jgi:serine/threonine protein kinase